MPKAKRSGNINKMKVLRVKNPKKKTKGTNTKDGKVFNPKGRKEKPSKKKDLMCRQIGKATVCFDKSKPKRTDRKVKHKKPYKKRQ